jgi:CRP-like cAMP-binding protein
MLTPSRQLVGTILSRMQSLPNRFLAALETAAQRRWQPILEPVALHAGQVLQEFDQDPGHLYFPNSALIALQQRQRDGSIAEVALVGCDGVVGAHLVFGADATMARAVVLTAGTAQRCTVSAFQQAVEADSVAMHATLQYLQYLVKHMAVTALCNRHHTPVQKLSRRVLEVLDRLPGAATVPEEVCLGGVAATALPTAHEALQQLCATGAVRLQAGEVSVLQRSGIERQVCSCYPSTGLPGQVAPFSASPAIARA